MPNNSGALTSAMQPALNGGLCRFGGRAIRQPGRDPRQVAIRSWTAIACTVFFVTVFSGCVTYLPLDEYNIARAAMEGARDKEAMKFAPNLWFKAEQAYREGEASYRDRRYDKARVMFEQARKLAEEAENAAHLSRFESGEIAP
jgi:hypothetical protein